MNGRRVAAAGSSGRRRAKPVLTADDMPYRAEQHPELDGDPVQTVEHLVRQFGVDPYEINNGLCDEFANEFIHRLGGSIWACGVSDGEFTRLSTHDFIEYRGRFFDAEAPEGVAHWSELPIFRRQLEEFSGLQEAIAAAEAKGPAWRPEPPPAAERRAEHLLRPRGRAS